MNSELNVNLFRAINDLGKDFPFLNPISIFVAEYMVYFLIIAVLLFWFTKSANNRVMVVSASMSFILAEIIGKFCGLLYSNKQPFVELTHVNKLIEKTVGNSFPSDHTMLFFTFCFSFFFFGKKFKYFWAILAICVALSRILVGVHYPFDVLAGATIGILSAYTCYRFVPRYKIFHDCIRFYEKIEHNLLSQKNKTNNF